jgi:antirestriction protein ArdC
MKVNEIITDQIIENLEKSGKWVKNWQSFNNLNIISNKEYRGINTLLLAMSREENAYKSNYWLTYKQAEQLKGNIKKGSKSTLVIFYTNLNPKTEKIDGKKMIDSNSPTFALRYYKVFNLDQTEGIDKPTKLIGEKNEDIPKALKLSHGYMKKQGITYNTGKDRASYSPLLDEINMPNLKQFKSSDSYYKTLFHEITHSTGHKTRLDRLQEGVSLNNDKEEYSKEELVAELGSLFLNSHVGLDINIRNSSAYIKGWCKALKNDSQMIISASSKAQKAYDYIIN